jgi:hypothetical protein
MEISKSNYKNYKFEAKSSRLEVPIIAPNDTVYIPIIFLSEYLGAVVSWGENNTINIETISYDIGQKWIAVADKLNITDMKYFWEREIGVRADKIRKNLKEEAVTENYWKENPVLYINKSDYRWGLAYKNLEEVVVIAYNGLTVTLATSKGEKTVTFTDSIKAMLAFYTQDPFVNSGWSEKIKEQIRNREISVV